MTSEPGPGGGLFLRRSGSAGAGGAGSAEAPATAGAADAAGAAAGAPGATVTGASGEGAGGAPDRENPHFPGEIVPPEPAAMRRVCGHFATGVTVVTSVADGSWIGATVNSFSSVSLEPPWVLFCLRLDSRLLTAIRSCGHFAVSILATEQAGVATRFAAPGLPSFDGLDCLTGAAGSPILRDSLGYLECKLAEEYPGGDHRIVVGAVTALGVLDERAVGGDAGPLTFYRGRLARLDKECER